MGVEDEAVLHRAVEGAAADPRSVERAGAAPPGAGSPGAWPSGARPSRAWPSGTSSSATVVAGTLNAGRSVRGGSAARSVAARLERGLPVLPFAGPLGALWDHVAAPRVARPFDPSHLERVPWISIGGATLGGSGKTPLAAAVALHLAARGARAAVVTREADEAQVLAEQLDQRSRGADGTAIVVRAPRARGLRAAAYAAVRPDVLVLDGPLQTFPVRATLALLALDGRAPWGAGCSPPSGDLRAPRAALLAAADLAVVVEDPADPPRAPLDLPIRCARALVVSEGARVPDASGGAAARWIGFHDLARCRVGLVTALARPARVSSFLAARGVVPAVELAAPDHAAPTAALCAAARSAARRASLDLWLCTAKCAANIHRAAAAAALGAPLAVLDHALVLDGDLTATLDRALALRCASNALP